MKGKILGSLFALPFFCVGVWMLWSIGGTFVSAWQMDGWVRAEARLTRGGFETLSGDDSSTYKAFASYHYDYDGRRYESYRVSLSNAADNIGSYQRELGRNLQSALASGNAILIYVDPAEPANAIIDRGVRWGLLGFKAIFLFVFGGIGLGLLIAIWKAPAPKDLTLAKYEDAPWLRNDAWQTSSIRSNSKSAMYGAWIFAILWSLVSAPIPFLLYEEVVAKQNYLAIIGALFPLVGIGLLIWALRRTLEWARFGAAPIRMDPFPGSIGGHVGGTIDLRLPFDAAQQFAVTLTCIHSYTSGSGKDKSQKERALWQDKLVAHAEPGATGTHLTFRFDVPEGQQASDTEKNNSYYIWRLNLHAAMPGTDLDRDYELPVYPTATQSRFLSSMAVEKSRDRQRALDDKSVRDLLNLESTAIGKRLYFPSGRHLGAASGGFVAGAVFAVAGWFLIVQAGHTLFGSVFGIVGGLIAICCLYMMLNSLEVMSSAEQIATVRRVLGIPIRRARMPKAAFAEFQKDSSFRTQSGNKHVIYYSIQALDRHGNKLVLGEGFKGENEANAAMRLIGAEFGLTAAANDAQLLDEGRFGPDVLTATGGKS